MSPDEEKTAFVLLVIAAAIFVGAVIVLGHFIIKFW
jgi:hypothetical protein